MLIIVCVFTSKFTSYKSSRLNLKLCVCLKTMALTCVQKQSVVIDYIDMLRDIPPLFEWFKLPSTNTSVYVWIYT